MKQKTIAWGVHGYTMLGGVFGIWALVQIVNQNTRLAWFYLLIAFVIDSTDGLLARKFRIRETLPHFDGAKVDDLIDFLTYVWAPVLILYTENLVGHVIWLALPIIGSLYTYGQTEVKSKDGEAFFIGFPCYWNVIALYIFWINPPALLTHAAIILFTVLAFVPIRYIYPSKNAMNPLLDWGLMILWLGLLGYMLLQPQPNRAIVMISLIYPLFYLGESFYVEGQYRRRERLLTSQE